MNPRVWLALLAILAAMLACDGTGDVNNRKKAAHWTPCYDGLTPLVTTDGREFCP